jgi:drug/metabolite transporter (DMT)-like permease
MIFLVLSSFLFGLNQPMAALLIKNSNSLLFSFQFLVTLVLLQLPLVLMKYKDIFRIFKNHFSLLFISGLIGTFLYWCEFSSLQVGLPISHLTLLTLTVPAWVLLYEYLRGRGALTNLNKWTLALLGTFFLITPGQSGEFSIFYLLPVFTSLLTALWLINSKKAQQEKIHPIVYSFFNDFFSLIGVFIFIIYNKSTSELALPIEFDKMSLYALIVGVLPNLFLFYGLRHSGIVKATTIIMLEPIIAGTLALMIHHEVLTINLMVGGALIVLSTIPANTLANIQNHLIYRFITKI